MAVEIRKLVSYKEDQINFTQMKKIKTVNKQAQNLTLSVKFRMEQLHRNII